MALRGIVISIFILLNPSTVDFNVNQAGPKPGDVIRNLEKRIINFPQEKIYLHTDKSIYSVGETIWFKPYLVDASDHLINTPSSLVHVELVDPNGAIVTNLNVKMDVGWNEGDIPIDLKWQTGDYILRGYTAYQSNYNHDYTFQKSITIGSAFEQVENVTSKPGDIELEFFPEGGNIIAGVRSNVAFIIKAGDRQLIDIKGVIKDQNGIQIGTFMTFTPGYGKFELNPEAGTKYYALINLNGKAIRYDLPDVIDHGFSLSADNRNEDHHLITVKASEKRSLKDAYVLAHVRGIPVALIEDLEGKLATFKIDKKSITDGIMHITLFDKDNIPQCERLIYNAHPTNIIETEITIPYSHFQKRQSAEVHFKFSDVNGDPVKGDFSVAITDAYVLPYNEWELNIESYLLMMSDLDRPVQHPGYYFQPETKSYGGSSRRILINTPVQGRN